MHNPMNPRSLHVSLLHSENFPPYGALTAGESQFVTMSMFVQGLWFGAHLYARERFNLEAS